MRERIAALILVVYVVSACSNDKLDVDISGIDYHLTFERFEKELVAGKTPQELDETNKNLIAEGGELYEFYVYDMLRMGSVYHDSIAYLLRTFVEDSMMQMVNQDITTEFSDFAQLEEEMTNSFKHLKYHLPSAPLPNKIITYNGTFVFGVISTDSIIGIGLEMYLGPENRIVKEIRFPLYMKDKMHRDYLSIDVAQSWLMTNVVGEQRGETFLSSMIYFGKLRYLIEAMLPKVGKELILRYTQEEYDYAIASEYNVWQYLVDMEWIYTTDMKVKLRFFEEAPTTVGIDQSPGRMGQFMGWQMVRQYMNENPGITVEELINEENETKILKAYKPSDNE